MIRSRIEFKRCFGLIGLLGCAIAALALVRVMVGDPRPIGQVSASVGAAASSGKPLFSLSRTLPEIGLAQEVACTLATTSTTTTDSNWSNNGFDTNIQVSNYTDLSLISQEDLPPDEVVTTTPDFFRLDNAIVGATYTIQAKPDKTLNYNLGIIVYDSSQQEILGDTDTSSYSASVTLSPDSPGPYFIKVFQVSAQCTGDTYSLIYNYTAPTSTPTATPTSTPGPTSTPAPVATWMTGFDQYEPNFGFNIATTIAPGLTYDMNFVPWGGGDVDNDFLKIRVKPGLQLMCETSNLDPAVDPRIVIYSGPSEGQYITSNDDIELGNFNSRISYSATYEGYVYILVGQGTRMAARDTVNSGYTIRCELTVPGEQPVQPGTTPAPDQTPVPDKDPATPVPTATPVPATATPTPVEEVALTFRLVTQPEPPAATEEPSGFRTFRVLVYYDADGDGQLGAGEGVAGFFIEVLSPDGLRELAQGYTDEQGQLSFTVPTVGTVRVLVPLLGVDRLIDASRPEVRVRIVPPALPETIP